MSRTDTREITADGLTSYANPNHYGKSHVAHRQLTVSDAHSGRLHLGIDGPDRIRLRRWWRQSFRRIREKGSRIVGRRFIGIYLQEPMRR
jgi:hypothetical protein